MATLHKVLVSNARFGETAAGETFTYTNGYGQLTKAGVQVQKGATAHADVAITMQLVTVDTTQSWFKEHAQVFTAAQQQRIQEHLDRKDSASAWNAIFAWGAAGQHDENYFRNVSAQSVTTQTDSEKTIVQSAKKVQTAHVEVTGTVDIVGLSMLPTTAFVFAQISTIQFADGTSIQVLDQDNPAAASASGDTSNVQARPKQLTVVPLKV